MKKKHLNLHSLESNDVQKIQTEVNKRLGEYKKTNTILKEDIFRILEMNANVIYYPIEDDDICGFLFQYKDKKFVYINSFIPFEKQIFAAAHELFHVWYSDLKRRGVTP